MVVADASAVVEMLLATPRGGAIAEHLLESGHPAIAPQLLDIEVLHVIRRFNRADRLTAARAEQALEDLGKLAITRYGHEPLRPAIWRLRNVLSALRRGVRGAGRTPRSLDRDLRRQAGAVDGPRCGVPTLLNRDGNAPDSPGELRWPTC